MDDLNIKTIGGNGTFEDVIKDAPPIMQEIARAARALLADVMPGITEVPWAQQKTVGYGIGPKKLSQHFCYLAPYSKWVNLGFMYGADLPDPQGLLVGSGQLMRHVKISTLAELQRPAIRELVEAAATHLPKLG